MGLGDWLRRRRTERAARNAAPPDPVQNATACARPSRNKKPRALRVTFRKFHQPDLHSYAGEISYAFSWNLSFQPEIGQWVMVRTSDGRDASAVISGLSTSENPKTLCPVLRLVPREEVEAGRAAWHAAKDATTHTWLDMARKKAGLPTSHELPGRVPQGYPSIPPKSGRVIGTAARDRGKVWWRAYNRASDLGRPDEEVQTFKAIGEFWYERSRMKE